MAGAADVRIWDRAEFVRDIGQAIEAPENDVLAMALSQEVRRAAEGLARLAAKALSREELALAHTSLL